MNEKSRGILIMLLISLVIILLASCGTMCKLTDTQLMHRTLIQKEIDDVYTEYRFTTDSLWIEYYKEDNNVIKSK